MKIKIGKFEIEIDPIILLTLVGVISMTIIAITTLIVGE